MAGQSNAAPVIIKRKKVVGGGGHHGGAWKVAIFTSFAETALYAGCLKPHAAAPVAF